MKPKNLRKELVKKITKQLDNSTYELLLEYQPAESTINCKEMIEIGNYTLCVNIQVEDFSTTTKDEYLPCQHNSDLAIVEVDILLDENNSEIELLPIEKNRLLNILIDRIFIGDTSIRDINSNS